MVEKRYGKEACDAVRESAEIAENLMKMQQTKNGGVMKIAATVAEDVLQAEMNQLKK